MIKAKNVSKTSWRHLEDVYWKWRWKTFSRRLEDVLIKTSIFAFVKKSQNFFQTSCTDVFKTSSRRFLFQDVFKTFTRHIQHVLKACWENDYLQKDLSMQQIKIFFIKLGIRKKKVAVSVNSQGIKVALKLNFLGFKFSHYNTFFWLLT